MKTISLAIAGLAASLASSTLSAHVGEHHDFGLLSGLSHLLAEHALPVGLFGAVAAGLLLKRLLRA